MITKAVCVILSILVACSDAEPSARIMGGSEATTGQFPYQVAIFWSKMFSCSGVILNNNYILTTSACVVNGVETYPAKKFLVRVGSNDYNSGGLLLKVKTVIKHEEYSAFLHNIALMELAEPLEFSERIQPIELLTEEVPEGSAVRVSGWGRNNPMTHSLPDNLIYIDLTAVGLVECSACNSFVKETDNCVQCLAANQTDDGPSNSDAGDPAVYEGKLAGIGFISSYLCDIMGYAKIPYYIDWIREHMV